ncbi:hypothetical protein [Micromonospora sp. NPDC001898]|uniref:hypothetical protein n=1 Tax=Micromonospora sp. NPDC001898 TaxID=3364221 RepID=UPI0036A34BE7
MSKGHARGSVGAAALTALLVLAAPTTAVAAPAGAAGPTSPTGDVTAAVTAKLLDQAASATDPGLRAAGADDTRVTVTRRDGRTWASGTAVVVAPAKEGAYPAGWVFVAHRDSAGWRIAFDGESAFADLAADAPSTVVWGTRSPTAPP